jgi:hypothetical protein
MKQDLEATIEKDHDAREQLKLYSVQLSQQAHRMAEKRAQISELEAQLSYHGEVIEELRTRLLANLIDRSNEETLVCASALADRAAADPSSTSSVIALPEQVPVRRTN